MKIFLRWCSIIYFGLVFYITFLARRRNGHTDYRALADFKIFDKFKVFGHWENLAKPQKLEYAQDIFGNVVLFLPFIPALYFLTRKDYSWKTALCWIVGTSAAIEINQYLFNRGVFDLDDIVLNTLGGLLGFWCYAMVRNRKWGVFK